MISVGEAMDWLLGLHRAGHWPAPDLRTTNKVTQVTIHMMVARFMGNLAGLSEELEVVISD